MRHEPARKRQNSFKRLAVEPLENRWLLTMVAVPSSTPGEIESVEEVDSYTFEAEVGTVYNITTTRGCDGCQEDTAAPRLVLKNSRGETEALKREWDDDAVIHWAASMDGIYTLEAGLGRSPGLGAYTLQIEGVTYADDHGNSTETASPISFATTVPGNIEVNGDADLFSFPAERGTEYSFALMTSMSRRMPSFELLDRDGTTTIQHSTRGRFGNPMYVPWIAPETGTYFVLIGRQNAITSEYTLRAEIPNDDHGSTVETATPVAIPFALSANLDFQFDADHFEFDAVAGTVYNVELTVPSGLDYHLRLFDGESSDGQVIATNEAEVPAIIQWMAPSSDLYYLQVLGYSENDIGEYRLNVTTVDYEDDYGNLVENATSIDAPSITPGSHEVASDVDSFSFLAVAGTRYNLFSDAISLLSVIDTDGTTPLALDPANTHDAPATPFITWTAPADGTYFVTAAGISVADYTLTIEIPVDDQSGGPATAIPIGIPSTNTGEHEFLGDVDFFSFDARAGVGYQVTGVGQNISLRLLAEDGVTTLVSEWLDLDDDKTMTWRPTTDGKLFIEVQEAVGQSIEPYMLTVEELLPCDVAGSEYGCNLSDVIHLVQQENVSTDTILQWLADASSTSNPLKARPDDIYVMGDTDLDGDVDQRDLGTLLAWFGHERPFLPWLSGELNGDGIVDSTDLGLLLRNFGHGVEPVAATIASVPINATQTPRSALPVAHSSVVANSDEASVDHVFSNPTRSEKIGSVDKSQSFSLRDAVFGSFEDDET